MKSLLLINPPFNIAKEKYDSSVSVGLLSIASFLVSRGIKIKIIDAARQVDYWNLLEKEIKNYDLAGLSVMTSQIPGALEISRFIRENNSRCQIIWGGAHPTFFVRETAVHPLVDIVVYGEGELTAYDLCSSKNLAEITGIAYKKEDTPVINLPRPLHQPAEMPLFNWELEPPEILENLSLIPSLTSRGCPHRCTFCINAILKNRWRMRTVEQVVRDVEIIKTKKYFRGKKLRFWDENFFVDIRRAKAIITKLIEKRLAIPWETTMRTDYVRAGMVDEKFLAELKTSGCYLLSFGAESGSPRILEKIQKGVTPEQTLNSAKLCLKHGIIPQYSFMIGLPGETMSDMLLTLKLIDQLVSLGGEVQILGPQAFRPYPGSPLYEECVAAGWQEPKSLEEWSNLMEHELNYLTVQNFPWIKDKDFVESIEAYVRFGAHSFKSAMSSSVSAQKALKLGFILLCKIRWKLKFFR